MSIISLTLKTFWRDFKAGRFNLLLGALIITISLITSLSFFYYRIELGAKQHFQTLLGADLLINSNQPIPEQWQDKARELDIQQSDAIQFYSVLFANEQLQLTDIQAVSDNFPLKGHFSVTTQVDKPAQAVSHGPKPGQLWFEPKLFDALKLRIGEAATLGKSSLKVSHYLVDEPARSGSWINLSPRAIMNLLDVKQTKVIQPGSRIQYQLYLAGNESQISQYKKWITPQLQSGQKIIDATESTPSFNNIADKVFNYLNLMAIAAILIAGITIALTSRYYANEQLKYCALLQSFGMRPINIFFIFASILVILSVIASLIGAILGYTAQTILIYFLHTLIPFDMPKWVFMPVLHGLLYALLITTGFGLPYFISLRKVPIKSLLSRLEIQYQFKTLWVYVFSISLIVIIIFWQTKQLTLTLVIVSSSVLGISLLWYLVHSLLNLLSSLKPKLPFALRQGFSMLLGYRKITILQIICTCTLITTIFTLTMSRNDLFQQWQQQLPDDAHNYFLINILESEQQSLQGLFQKNQVDFSKFYPIVRARLTEKNNQSFIEQLTEEKKQDPSLHRDLNLSETMQLPNDNKIIEGQWWPENAAQKHWISVEEQLASRLDIKLGDELTFQVANKSFNGSVTNIRSVQWDNFQPNFYFLFPDGILKQFPYTYLTSFYLPDSKQALLSEIVKQYPSVTVIDISDMIKRFTGFIHYFMSAINYVLFFTVIIGLVMLAAIAQVNWKNYQAMIAILRTLGADNKQIKTIIVGQYCMLGIIGGLLGALFTTLTAWSLAKFLFDFSYHLNWLPWIAAPIMSGLIFFLMGLSNIKQLLKSSPIHLIKAI